MNKSAVFYYAVKIDDGYAVYVGISTRSSGIFLEGKMVTRFCPKGVEVIASRKIDMPLPILFLRPFR